jgi:hypothetical protein
MCPITDGLSHLPALLFVASACAANSRVSTPVKRKNRDFGGGRGDGYGSGQINAYPPPAAGANPAAGAVMMSLAEELLTKKGLSLKDLQV